MEAWKTFWTLWLLFSGAAFALITVVVTIKGFGDVKRMLSGMTKQHDQQQ
ncbi:MAG TPA: hypothetical protein VHB79_34065 [Polyangiaceae bacterium]|nr:hypothetical protein [Polyangiaceae bacterium]